MKHLPVGILAILGAVLAYGILVPPHFGSNPAEARRMAAQVSISELGTAIDKFKFDCGRYPTMQESFTALMKRPGAIPADRWQGPYWSRGDIPLDPWGHSYAYRCPGRRNTNGYDISSGGPADTTEAIGNWSLSNR